MLISLDDSVIEHIHEVLVAELRITHAGKELVRIAVELKLQRYLYVEEILLEGAGEAFLEYLDIFVELLVLHAQQSACK